MAKILFQIKPVTSADISGPFYVLDCFSYPEFVIDEEGVPKTFDRYEEAMQEAEDCQQGMVIVFG